jgi:hypothetical protein
MAEVANILISAAVGFGLGIAGQPITHALTKWLNSRDVRNALYSDLGRIYHLLSRAVDLGQVITKPASGDDEERERAARIVDSIDLGAYKHFSNGQAAVFWSLSESSALKRLYESLENMISARSAGLVSWEITLGSIKHWFETIERFFREGVIDSTKLLAERANARDTTLNQITKYYTSKEGPPIRDNRP